MITIRHYAFTTKEHLEYMYLITSDKRGQLLINLTKPFNLNLTGEVFRILFTAR